MKLSDVGEARIRGYLYVLGRSLRSFLPPDVAADAVREVESHIHDRIDQADATPDERAAVERVLAVLGPPLRVAQAYSQEMTLDEAITTGRLAPTLRALWHGATTSVLGFAWAMIVFIGWTLGVALLAMPVLKPIFPNNVGYFTLNGKFIGFGAQFGLPPGTEAHGGFWIVPACLVAGFLCLLVTRLASRRILSWMRTRKSPVRFALKVEVREGGSNRG